MQLAFRLPPQATASAKLAKETIFLWQSWGQKAMGGQLATTAGGS
jgi:hypothetical protein